MTSNDIDSSPGRRDSFFRMAMPQVKYVVSDWFSVLSYLRTRTNVVDSITRPLPTESITKTRDLENALEILPEWFLLSFRLVSYLGSGAGLSLIVCCPHFGWPCIGAMSKNEVQYSLTEQGESSIFNGLRVAFHLKFPVPQGSEAWCTPYPGLCHFRGHFAAIRPVPQGLVANSLVE